MPEKRQKITHLMLERLINIHKEIRDGNYPNTTELAKKFNDGKGISTISRDIEFLRDRFYAPIEYDYIRKGYYYTEKFEMPINNISSDKLQTLFAAKHLLAHFEDSPIYAEISNIIDFLTDTTIKEDSEFLSRIALPPIPKFIVDKEILNKVYEALKNNFIIEFDYQGRRRAENTHRKVHPYQLVLDDGKYYLYGYSEEREAVRIFSLGRIENLTITEKTFKLPKKFEFSKKCGNGRFGTFISENTDKYKIEFYDFSRPMVKSSIWADDQVLEDDDKRNCTTITFTSTQTVKVEEWVLSQGMYAKPLEPEWLVNAWKAHIKNMCKMAGIKS
jgi:predicted DNA-binding transcriptional regulator YafY